MATPLYLRSGAATPPVPEIGWHGERLDAPSGTQIVNAWGLSTARGSGVTSQTINSVAGPTNGIATVCYISPPLAAGVTISGTVTYNIWGNESSMAGNMGLFGRLYQIKNDGTIFFFSGTSAKGVELALTTNAVNNWTVAPVSTVFNKGDRIMAVIGFIDAGGTMATAATGSYSMGSASAGVDGDSYIQFTETLTFLTGTPAGSQLWLRDSAVSESLGYQMGTTAGTAQVFSGDNPVTGPVTPMQLHNNTSPFSALAWYTKPLAAFTLSGLVKCTIMAAANNAQVNTTAVRAELAVCNLDGSLSSVWAISGESALKGANMSIVTVGTPAAQEIFMSAPDKAITAGQRLRLRLFIDDSMNTMTAGSGGPFTISVGYGHSTGQCASSIVLPNVITTIPVFGGGISAQSAVSGNVRPGPFPATPQLDTFIDASAPRLLANYDSAHWQIGQNAGPSAQYSTSATGDVAYINQATSTYTENWWVGDFTDCEVWGQVNEDPVGIHYMTLFARGISVVSGAGTNYYSLTLDNTGLLQLTRGDLGSPLASYNLGDMTGCSFGMRLKGNKITMWLKRPPADWTYLGVVTDSTLTHGQIGIGGAGISSPRDPSWALIGGGNLPVAQPITPGLGGIGVYSTVSGNVVPNPFPTTGTLDNFNDASQPRSLPVYDSAHWVHGSGSSFDFKTGSASNANLQNTAAEDWWVGNLGDSEAYVTFDSAPNTGNTFAVMARGINVVSGTQDYYAVYFDAGTAQISLMRIGGGVLGNWLGIGIYLGGGIGIRCKGTRIEAWYKSVSGSPWTYLGSVNDSTLASGQIGIQATGGSGNPSIDTFSGGSMPAVIFFAPATITATSTVSGSVRVLRKVVPGAISATSTVNGNIGVRRRVAPTTNILPVSAVSGSLSRARPLPLQSVGATSTVSGSVRVLRRIAPSGGIPAFTAIGVTSDFTGTDGVLPTGWAGPSRNQASNCLINTNRLARGAVGNGSSCYNTPVASSTIDVKCDVPVLGGSGVAIMLLSNPTSAAPNGYMLFMASGGFFTVYRIDAGAVVLLGTGNVASSFVAGDQIGLRRGTSGALEIYINHASAGFSLATTRTDSTYDVNGYYGGTEIYDTTGRLDNFGVGAFSAAAAGVSATSTVGGNVTAQKRVTPTTISAQSTVVGSIRALKRVSPTTISAVSTVTGTSVIALRRISGLISAVATVTGAITKLTGGPKPIVPTGSYSARIASLAPLSYWRLNETSGTTAVDARGLHDGTYMASPTLGVTGLLTGDTDKAMQMNGGTGQGVSIGNQSEYQIGDLTIEAWIKTSSTDGVYHSILVKQFAFGMFVFNGLLTCYDWGGSASNSSGVNVGDGVRHHVVAVLRSGVTNGSQMYVDGAAAGSPFSYAVQQHTTVLCVGTNAGPAQEFNGVIDEPAIYNYMLSAAQILGNYQAGTGASGAINATSTVSGTVTKLTGGPKAIVPGAISAVSTVAGSVRALRRVAPTTISAISTVGGSVGRLRPIIPAQISPVSTTSGSVAKRFLVKPANVTAASIVSGTVTKPSTARPIAGGVISAVSTVAGSIRALRRVAPATITPISTVSGSLRALRRVAPANISGISAVSGSFFTAFNPAVLSGLGFWLDANDPASFSYSSGAVVSQWNDKTTGAHHLSQATVGLQPTRNGSRAGKPTVVFNGGYLAWTGNTGLNVGAVTVFVVATSTVESAGLFTAWAAGQPDYSSFAAFTMGCGTAVRSDIMETARGTYVGNSNLGMIPGTMPTPFGVYEAVFTPAGANDVYANGVAGTSGSNPGTFGVADGGYLVGGRVITGTIDAAYRLIGDVAEIVVYNRVLSGSERLQVENYLTSKWFVTAKPVVPAAITATSTVGGAVVKGPVKAITANISAVSTVSGGVRKLAKISGQISATSSVSGTVVALRRILPAQISAVSAVSGLVIVRRAVAGLISAVSTVSGQVRPLRRVLPVNIVATSTVAGQVQKIFRIVTGQINATSTLAGSIATHPVKVITGLGINPISTVSGSLRVVRRIPVTAISATSTISGSIKFVRITSANVSAVTTVSGTVRRARAILPVTIQATSTVSGSLRRLVAVTGNISATTTVSGGLVGARKITGANISASTTVSGKTVMKRVLTVSAISATSTVTGRISRRFRLPTANITAFSTMGGKLTLALRLSNIIAISTVTGSIIATSAIFGGGDNNSLVGVGDEATVLFSAYPSATLVSANGESTTLNSVTKA